MASVVGADIDRRILFQAERIETYFVDQTQPETLAALFHQLGEGPIDLVIDDGLHTFEANLNVYRAAYPRISPDGFLVIEDVRDEDVPRWADLLAAADHVGAIVRLPHQATIPTTAWCWFPGKRSPSNGKYQTEEFGGIAKTDSCGCSSLVTIPACFTPW